ncbi:MAG: MarR family transcriptional regulator, partial [Oscillospiraceae bacterium]
EISAPNATYKVGSLVRKGYIRRVQSTTDKREYYLEVSDKFLTYYGVSYDYLKTVTDRIRTRFSPAEVEQLERMLTIVSRELMSEIPVRAADSKEDAR